MTSTRHRNSHRSAAAPDALGARIQQLATGLFVIGIAGTVTASRMQSALGPTAAPETSRLLQEIKAHTARASRMPPPRSGVYDSLKTINDQIEAIHRAADVSSLREARAQGAGLCGVSAEPAQAYLSTTTGSLDLNVTFEFTTYAGVESIDLTSAMTQSQIIASINAIGFSLGIEASQSQLNPDRIEVRTTEANADAVLFAEIGFSSHGSLLFPDPIGGEGAYELKDYGRNEITLAAVLR